MRENLKSTGTFVIINLDYGQNSGVDEVNNILHHIKKMNLNVKDCFTIYGDNNFSEHAAFDRFSMNVFPSLNCDTKETDFIKYLGKYLMLNNCDYHNSNFFISEDNVLELEFPFDVENFIKPESKKLHNDNCEIIFDLFTEEHIYEVMLNTETNQYVLASYKLDESHNHYSDAWIEFDETDNHFYVYSDDGGDEYDNEV